MGDYIDRDAVLKLISTPPSSLTTDREDRLIHAFVSTIQNFPAADVVPNAAYNQARWERDIAVSQLKEIGKGLGEKMDDVEPVRHGEWVKQSGSLWPVGHCSLCDELVVGTNRTNYCPNCGAEMEGDFND